MRAKLIKVLEHYHLYDGDKAIATTIVGNPMLLPNISLKNCQAIANGYDLENMADFYGAKAKDSLDFKLGANKGFEDGFQKAIEILSDKKFTYNQMVSAITESSISHRLPSLIIQDLQQTEWDVEIETDVIYGIVDYKKLREKPKFDSNNCLILKRK